MADQACVFAAHGTTNGTLSSINNDDVYVAVYWRSCDEFIAQLARRSVLVWCVWKRLNPRNCGQFAR